MGLIGVRMRRMHLPVILDHLGHAVVDCATDDSDLAQGLRTFFFEVQHQLDTFDLILDATNAAAAWQPYTG